MGVRFVPASEIKAGDVLILSATVPFTTREVQAVGRNKKTNQVLLVMEGHTEPWTIDASIHVRCTSNSPNCNRTFHPLQSEAAPNLGR